MYVCVYEWSGTKAGVESALIKRDHADVHPFPSGIGEGVFVEQMKDVIECWIMDYFRGGIKIHTIDKEQHEKLFLHKL